MKQVIILLALCIFIAGCATLDSVRNENRENINKLSVGITKEQVQDIMGTETKSAGAPLLVNVMSLGAAITHSQKISNPYKIEVFKDKNGETIEVWWYYTDIQSRDGAITDDELTPVLFKNNLVIGWGRSYLDNSVDKHELKMR